MADADLKECRELYAFDEKEWAPIKTEGTTDMQYAAGDPWTEKDRTKRELAGRPCLNADEISQYINQTVNEVRANKKAVKFTPNGNGATDDTAEFYANKMREIEYRSRAQIGYTTAFENAVCRSYGFVRVNARYAHPRAVNQDLWIDPVPNPNLVTPDACALMPDLSDMRHCWVREKWTLADFDQRWSKYKVGKPSSDTIKHSAGWVSETGVFVGEYWTIKTKDRKLVIVQPQDGSDPIGLFEDEYDAAMGAVLSERTVQDATVVQQLTNGLAIIEETEWPGQYIPIVGCLGKILYLDESGASRRHILSMIRLARDPQMLYAYLVTCEAELIGMTPKFPYFVYEGQLSNIELDRLQKSLHEPVAVVQVRATLENVLPGSPLPFPQRQPYEPPLQPIEIAKEAARRSIQAAMGQTPLPTAAQRRNEKSGVALKHIDELGQRGSFHFTDHYLDMITHVGIIVEDLMGAIYDTPRDVGIRKADDTADVIRINDPERKSVRTNGDHLVTVSSGPSFDSERDAADDFGDTVLSSGVLELVGPQKGPQLLAKVIKLKNLGPIGDEIINILDPQPAKNGQPNPQQLQQAAQQMQGQLEEMGKALQQAAMEKQTDKIKQDAMLRKAEIDNNAAIAIQILRNENAIAVQHLQNLQKGVALDAHAIEEAAAMGHERNMASADNRHEHGMAELAHAHSLDASEQAHEQGLEAGDVSHGQMLEQQAQAADLAPQPEAGA